MPPPQPVLASRFPGFVCRSCLSKSKGQRATPWLPRNVTSKASPSKTENDREKKTISNLSALPPPQQPSFRFFEETPDGTRREVKGDDLDLGSLDANDLKSRMNALRSQLKGLNSSITSHIKKVTAVLSPEERSRATNSRSKSSDTEGRPIHPLDM